MHVVELFWVRVDPRDVVGPTAELEVVDNKYVARADYDGRLIGGRAIIGKYLLAALDDVEYVIKSNDYEVV